MCITVEANNSSIYKIDTEDCNQIVTDIEPAASAKAKEVVHNVVQNYQAVSTKSTNIQMRLTLNDDKPIHSRPRRFSYSERCIIDKQTDQWLKDGVIETSESEYSSPVVLVNKRDGSHRLCIDYRRINKVIIRDHFPLPLIEDQLDRLQDARIFSSIDLKNGFFHVGIEEGSRKYTSFVTHNEQFQFLRVPFGFPIRRAYFSDM